MATVYRIGTSGFSYPHWRGAFYPKGVPQARRLEHFAQQFSTVEGRGQGCLDCAAEGAKRQQGSAAR